LLSKVWKEPSFFLGSVPVVVFYNNGKEICRKHGFMVKSALNAFLHETLNEPAAERI
jgi:hypothetical protein